MNRQKNQFLARHYLVLGFLLLCFVALAVRLVYLHVFNQSFLAKESRQRTLRTLTLPAHRGIISDRHGALLAVSIPVESVWAVPYELAQLPDKLFQQLATIMHTTVSHIKNEVENHRQKDFFYLKRQVPDTMAEALKQQKFPGIYLQKEYRRFYPLADITVHLLGFTNIDEQGQEGLERQYNSLLTGTNGSKQVIKDRRGNVIEDFSKLNPPQSGKNLTLSIDKRLQYIAFNALKKAVYQHQAIGGSVVVTNPNTGEILALVNMPTINPNNRAKLNPQRYRNRAATDLFEPGSVIKPFAMLAFLQAGHVTVNTMINTNPGFIKIGPEVIHDVRNYSTLSVSDVLVKSSNVGMSKLALNTDDKALIDLYQKLGFGIQTNHEICGEGSGRLPVLPLESIAKASLSFGYGLSITSLQLAQAYGVLAAGGIKYPLTLFKRQAPSAGQRVAAQDTVLKVNTMLKDAVSIHGTGSRAKPYWYTVAGKTGTTKKIGKKGYSNHHYVATFAGFAPFYHPRLVVAVNIDDPKDQYYGGLVAAPVFKEVVAKSLHALGILPEEVRHG